MIMGKPFESPKIVMDTKNGNLPTCRGMSEEVSFE